MEVSDPYKELPTELADCDGRQLYLTELFKRVNPCGVVFFNKDNEYELMVGCWNWLMAMNDGKPVCPLVMERLPTGWRMFCPGNKAIKFMVSLDVGPGEIEVPAIRLRAVNFVGIDPRPGRYEYFDLPTWP